jgi:serine/threonine-protein kinase
LDLRDELQSTLGSSYAIERELGGGGMSRVFLAQETALRRMVVVKVLPAEMSGEVSADRFKREIALAAALQHPHIVPLLTAGDAGGVPYFTMPYVQGESLRARLTKHGELPVSEAMRILREVASALAFAHDAGIVHRDIKPDNVLISGGAAMVTDFGVAKALTPSTTDGAGTITALGVALGTPAYMAPEQATADPIIDHRADIYAWGILAYELLTGSTPFAGRVSQAILAAQVQEEPEPVAKRRRICRRRWPCSSCAVWQNVPRIGRNTRRSSCARSTRW